MVEFYFFFGEMNFFVFVNMKKKVDYKGIELSYLLFFFFS